ncbi:MAG: hypothetical protein DME26_20400 [Verrucomicrobia bacterium]|nr:MAG: hypothetical protein DME26_20400 [Verrucomicrobiota bacterium]
MDYDSFTWAPVIKVQVGRGVPAEPHAREWNAKNEFSGPPREKPKRLGSWEKYAQVLLLANEFMFVD